MPYQGIEQAQTLASDAYNAPPQLGEVMQTEETVQGVLLCGAF